MVKLIHTADWHLGCRLETIERRHEHQAFLCHLLELLEKMHPDALLICGDVFDSANPPLSAQKDLFDFLLKAREICPNIIAIAGNHDSAARFDTLATLLDGLGIHFCGILPEHDDRALIPVLDSRGQTIAEVAAVPFLRGADLPPPSPGETPEESMIRMVDATTAIMQEFNALHSNGENPDKPLIYMGHLFAAGGRTTEDSERPVQTIAGNVCSLPAEIYPESAAYVALGHLHRRQQITHPAGVSVWYSGSVIPMSFTEADYQHQVLEVKIPARPDQSEETKEVEIVSHELPRGMKMVDVIGKEMEVTDKVQKLAQNHPDPSDMVLVRVMVELSGPAPALRQNLADLAEGTGVKIMAVRRTDFENETMHRLLDDNQSLHDLKPEEVFRLMHRMEYHADPEDALMTAFSELLHQVTVESGSDNGEEV